MDAAWLIAFSTAATFAGLGPSESSCISLRTHTELQQRGLRTSVLPSWESPADRLRAEVRPTLYLMAELLEGSGVFEAETRKGSRGL